MSKTDKIIEMICTRGCKSVNRVRQQLRRGETISELSGLTSQERNRVRLELDSIMSVYENRKTLLAV